MFLHIIKLCDVPEFIYIFEVVFLSFLLLQRVPLWAPALWSFVVIVLVPPELMKLKLNLVEQELNVVPFKIANLHRVTGTIARVLVSSYGEWMEWYEEKLPTLELFLIGIRGRAQRV